MPPRLPVSPRDERTARFVDLACLVALAAGLVVLWRWRVLGSATTVSTRGAGDTFSYFLPAYVYEASRVAHGGFPFWNPYQGAGVPFLATLQPGALYPGRLLMLVASPARAMGWSVFLHVLLALVGTYALCRRLGATALASATGAIVFATAFALPALSGPTLLEPGAWHPVIALAAVSIVQGGGWPWVVALGIAGAMPALAGGYQMTLYAVYVAGCFVLAALLDRRARGEPIGAVVWGLAVAGLLAFATAAPQLLTTFAWSAEASRQTKTLTNAQIIPLVTNEARSDRVWRFFFDGTPHGDAYYSIPVLLAAALAAVRLRPIGTALGLAALVTARLAVVAPGTWLFALYRAIPGFAIFRFPTRMLVMTSLLVAAGAALGVTALGRWPALAAPRRRRLVESAMLALVVLLLVSPFRNEWVFPWSDASPLARPNPAFLPGSTRPPADERASVPGDRFELGLAAFVRQGTLQRVRVLEDYEPLSSRRLGVFISTIAGQPPPRDDAFLPFTGAILTSTPSKRPDLFDLVSVGAIVVSPGAVPPVPVRGWTSVAEHGGFVTFRNDRALPRAYVVAHATFVADEAAALAGITVRWFTPRTDVVLVGTPSDDAERALAAAGQTELVPAHLAVDEPERLVVELDGTHAGVLVVTDAFAPGWEARVDGEPRRIWQANYLVRGIVVRPGDRRVELRYVAPGFAAGMWILGLGWTVFGAALALGIRRRGTTTVR
jgi:hypothetical protein